jgi:hypothetical protein
MNVDVKLSEGLRYLITFPITFSMPKIKKTRMGPGLKSRINILKLSMR